jgi:hypothetical protein
MAVLDESKYFDKLKILLHFGVYEDLPEDHTSELRGKYRNSFQNMKLPPYKPKIRVIITELAAPTSPVSTFTLSYAMEFLLSICAYIAFTINKKLDTSMIFSKNYVPYS